MPIIPRVELTLSRRVTAIHPVKGKGHAREHIRATEGAVLAAAVACDALKASDAPTASAQLVFDNTRDTWHWSGLELGASGHPYASVDNVLRILAAHPRTAGRFSYDEFSSCVLCNGKPWNAALQSSALATLLRRDTCMPHLSAPVVTFAVEAYAQQKRVHPIKSYLGGLTCCAGAARLEELFSRGFGAADTTHTRAAARTFLVSAIARIYDPGCLMRHLVVLEGAERSATTRALYDLFRPWMLESACKIASSQFEQSIAGHWCIVLSNFASMLESDVEAVRATLTRRDEYIGAPWGRPNPRPRSCIFVGTTSSVWGKTDAMDGLRFLPIACGAIDHEWLEQNRTQLWAEALALYRAGIRYEALLAELATPEPPASDDWDEPIATIIAGRKGITRIELFDALGIAHADRGYCNSKRLKERMGRLGWNQRTEKGAHRKNYRIYRPRPRLAPPLQPASSPSEVPAGIHAL